MTSPTVRKSFFASKRNVIFTALLYTFLWGCAFPLVKLCMQGFAIEDADNMSKCLVAGMRFTLSGILTLAWQMAKGGQPRLQGAQVKHVLLYGLLATFLQYGFTYIGLSRIDGSKGAIFDQLCVFLIVLCSGLFFKNDKLTVLKVLGCVLGFAGVLFSSTEKFTLVFSLGGEGAMLMAALCQTAAYFIAKAASGKVSELTLVGFGQLLGGVGLCIFGFLGGGRITVFPMHAVIILILLALISSVAYVLSLMPLRFFPASEISAFNLLIPLFGIVMSGLMLSENIFRPNYLLAALLITAGILLINVRQKSKQEANP